MRMLVAVMQSRMVGGRERFYPVLSDELKAIDVLESLTGEALHLENAGDTPAKDDYWVEVPDRLVEEFTSPVNNQWEVHVPGVGLATASIPESNNG